MYGSRGANGVMIITTNTGADMEKPIINFRVEGNMASPTSKIDLADGVTYMNLFNEAVGNLGTQLPFSQDKIEGTELELNPYRSEEHTSELQSRGHLVCRLLLE